MGSLTAVQIADQAEAFFANSGDKPGIFVPKTPAMNAIDSGGNSVEFRYDSMEEAFPAVDPGHLPMGNLVLVQVRQPKDRTKGGIIIDAESRKTEHDNTQVAKIIALGDLAFKNRETMKPWPEGAWAAVGDFVRVPKYQGDRFSVQFRRLDTAVDPVTGATTTQWVTDAATFAFVKDLALIAKVTCDPLLVRSYLGV